MWIGSSNLSPQGPETSSGGFRLSIWRSRKCFWEVQIDILEGPEIDLEGLGCDPGTLDLIRSGGGGQIFEKVLFFFDTYPHSGGDNDVRWN